MKKLLFSYLIIFPSIFITHLQAQSLNEPARNNHAIYLEVSSIVAASSVNLYYETNLGSWEHVAINAQLGGGLFYNITDYYDLYGGSNIQMGVVAFFGKKTDFFELGLGGVGTNLTGEKFWEIYGKSHIAYRVETRYGLLLKMGLQGIAEQEIINRNRSFRALPLGFCSIGYAF